MRITQNALFDQIRFQIERNSRSLFKAQETVATQKRINRVSDSPIDAPRLLDIKRSKAQVEQYQRNIERTNTLDDLYDSSLGQADDLIKRAKELLLGEANEVSSTPETRQAARLEISTLTSQLVQLANTQFDGKYIYSGFASDTPAFQEASLSVTAAGGNTGGAIFTSSRVLEPSRIAYDAFQIQFTGPGTYNIVDTTTGATTVSGATYTSGAAIAFNGIQIVIADSGGPPAAGDVFNVGITPPGNYQGDSGLSRVEIQAGQQVQQNILGSRAFNGTGITNGTDVFNVLNRINTALRSNDRSQIEGLLDELDAGRTQVAAERAAVGSRQNLLKSVLDRHKDVATSLESMRSELEDADLTEAITKMTQQQNAFESTLGTAARISQISLLDFLR